METAKRFTNFSNEDFSHKYDGKLWEFPVGETMLLQTDLADHFAKHLIDRELNKLGEKTNNLVKRKELMDKCIGEKVVSAESSEKLSTKIMNDDKKEEPKKTPKDAMPPETETPPEEEKVEKEFEDLDDKKEEPKKVDVKLEVGPAEATDKVSTPKVDTKKVDVKDPIVKKTEVKK